MHFLTPEHPTALNLGPNDAPRENERHQSGYFQRIIRYHNRAWLKKDRLLIAEAKVSNRGYNNDKDNELRMTTE